MHSSEAAVRFDMVSKRFGATRALDDVGFEIASRSIHAVVGENGAGKSTIGKILVGEVAADSGTVLVNGRGPNPRDPRDAARRGIGMVHQEFLLAPDLTVWENVVLGWEGSSVRLRRRELRARVREVADGYGMSLPLDEIVGRLPIALQQRVEIVKALFRGADILVLDEPTAVLTPRETAGLFVAMRKLRDQGKTLVFVSHKLKEVLEIADRITVMRGGRFIESLQPESVSERELAELIIGRRLDPVVRTANAIGDVAVALEDVHAPGARGSTGLRSCTFDARRGEVVGVAGVSGNGQDELVDILSGLTVPARGSVSFPELPVLRADADSLRRAGLSYVPADRGRTATAPGEPLWFSAIAGLPRTARSRARMPIGPAQQLGERIRTAFGVKAASVRALPSELSGGNLQKFIVGREILREPRVLVAFEPTRGIDIGAARQIRQRMRDLAHDGAAVIVLSSDLDELLEIADRLVVLNGGRVTADLDPLTATMQEIGTAMTTSAAEELS